MSGAPEKNSQQYKKQIIAARMPVLAFTGTAGGAIGLTLYFLGVPVLANGPFAFLAFFIPPVGLSNFFGLLILAGTEAVRKKLEAGSFFHKVLSPWSIGPALFFFILIPALFFILLPLMPYTDRGMAFEAAVKAFAISACFHAAGAVLSLVFRNHRNVMAAATFIFITGCMLVVNFLLSAAPEVPRVILVTIDTLRADRVGCYGYRGGTTPFIDGMAARGVVFEEAYCASPITDPSHTAILTGMHPRSTGVIYNGYPVSAKKIDSIARAFAEGGYETAAITSRVHLDPESLGIPGFAHVSSPAGKALDTPASQATRRAGVWLRKNRKKPTFLWVHYWDPHEPYYPPEKFRARFAPGVNSMGRAPVWLDRTNQLPKKRIADLSRLYDGEVAYVDAELKRLHEFVSKLAPDADEMTAWIIVSDHGEILGEISDRYPYGFGHAEFLYQGAVRVPWIVAGRGIHDNKRIPGPVSTVDLTPTVLDLLGMPPLNVSEGKSLVPFIEGEGGEQSQPVFMERTLPSGGPIDLAKDPLHALVSGHMKWIGSPAGHAELYDLAKDPAENQDLSKARPEKAEAMEQVFSRWDREHRPAEPAADSVKPVTARDFRSLGYFR